MKTSAGKVVDSPVGKLYLAATETGLTHVLFVEGMDRKPKRAEGSAPAERILCTTEQQLSEYFARKRKEFDVQLAPAGTEFQLATWRALRDIPFGETISYGELARRMNRPRAVRAVGAANGANPISIIVPCHRVIGADGTLTGYGGGLRIKKRLLELEQGMRTWL
jgi:methylated-DNA-[protein]-cysteine S-methyltransferase